MCLKPPINDNNNNDNNNNNSNNNNNKQSCGEFCGAQSLNLFTVTTKALAKNLHITITNLQ